jgi:hypothetical protein
LELPQLLLEPLPQLSLELPQLLLELPQLLLELPQLLFEPLLPQLLLELPLPQLPLEPLPQSCAKAQMAAARSVVVTST